MMREERNMLSRRKVLQGTGAITIATPLETMSNKISEGKSNGWALIYARGPEGEALEFVQALGPVKQIFEGALEKRQKEVS